MANWDELAAQHPRYERLAAKYRDESRPRKLLALDGGGIRGVITLQVLKTLEDKLKKETGGGDDFRLGDYFDYVGGTSTGAIIAACLAFGFTVDEIIGLYDRLGKGMFKKPKNPVKWLWYKYLSTPLEGQLKSIFGKDEDGDDFKLGSGRLRCLLLVVLRNVTTDSFWPISSNPFARYNLGEGADYAKKNSNLYVPLYQLVRGSTAAPTFFAPQKIEVRSKKSVKTFKFEDGGVTPYNNPAFLLYRMATVPAYNLAWAKGERRLLLVSVGTGAAPELNDNMRASFLLSNASLVPKALMYGALVDQDINCRMTGYCVHGARIDRELGDMIPPGASKEEGPKFTPPEGAPERAFTYARYNAELSPDWLKEKGFGGLDPNKVGKLDSTDHIEDLRRIGQKVAEEVNVSQFRDFI
ncbi:MAG TPA: patatin-like phospholipase family protein [Pyrinomonadaceae bacterium]|nr:patatin-like phospholipase family protein [Pyrinomonadaceae bacterium]